MRRPQLRAGLRAPIAVALAAALLLPAASCSFDEGTGGSGLPTLGVDEQVDGDPTPFEGVVRVARNGCVGVLVTTPDDGASERWAVWPAGAEQASGGAGAQVGDQVFVDEDRVSGTARSVDLAALPGGGTPGSYFEGAGRYCGADTGGVLVIEEIRHPGAAEQ